MICERGKNSGSKPNRGNLKIEEKKSGVDKWEIHLSKFSHKTMDCDEYLRCLKEKAESDLSTLSFYLRRTWRKL